MSDCMMNTGLLNELKVIQVIRTHYDPSFIVTASHMYIENQLKNETITLQQK